MAAHTYSLSTCRCPFTPFYYLPLATSDSPWLVATLYLARTVLPSRYSVLLCPYYLPLSAFCWLLLFFVSCLYLLCVIFHPCVTPQYLLPAVYLLLTVVLSSYYMLLVPDYLSNFLFASFYWSLLISYLLLTAFANFGSPSTSHSSLLTSRYFLFLINIINYRYYWILTPPLLVILLFATDQSVVATCSWYYLSLSTSYYLFTTFCLLLTTIKPLSLVTFSHKLGFVFDAGRIHISDGVAGLSF